MLLQKSKFGNSFWTNTHFHKILNFIFIESFEMQIVFVGAGGTGMSNLVHILRELGWQNIIAIDSNESELLGKLKSKGIKTFVGHGQYQVQAEDLLIYSEAAKESPEVVRAFQLKREQQQPLKIWSYFQFLGEISKYFTTVGFAGTNGKSSSTSIGIFAAQQLLPDFALGIVGALIPDLNNQGYYLDVSKKSELHQIFSFILSGKQLPYELIKKYLFFIEACEYRRHFLLLDIDYLLISNLELDHTDYFEDEKDYLSAFDARVTKTKQKVFLLAEEPSIQLLQKSDKFQIVPTQHFQLNHLRGRHTDHNISLVTAMLQSFDPSIDSTKMEQVLKNFHGTWRRMEYLGTTSKGAKVFSDYGHIASSLALGYETLRERFPDQKITLLFQPHQAKRVVDGWDDFLQEIQLYEERYIYQLYTAREQLQYFTQTPLFQEHRFDSFEVLGNFFAQQADARYLANSE